MLSTRSISHLVKDEDEILRLSAQDDITMQSLLQAKNIF